MLWAHHLGWYWHHSWQGWLYFCWKKAWVYSGLLSAYTCWFEAVVTVVTIKLLLLLLVQNVFIHFSCVIPLSIVHLVKIVKDVSFKWFFLINFEHFVSSFIVKEITVLGLGDLLVFNIVEAIKMFIVDVLDVDPLDDEEPLELHWVVLPPEGERLFVVIRSQPGNSFKHSWLHDTEKQVNFSLVLEVFLPELLKLSLVLRCSCPDSVFDCLMNVVIVCATNYQTDVVLCLCFLSWVNVFQVRKSLHDGIEIMVVLGLMVWPSFIDGSHNFTEVIIGVHQNLKCQQINSVINNSVINKWDYNFAF